MSLDDSLRRTANQAFFDRLYVQDDNWIEGQVGEPFNIVFDPEIQKLALRREAEGESGTQTSSVARLNDDHLVVLSGQSWNKGGWERVHQLLVGWSDEQDNSGVTRRLIQELGVQPRLLGGMPRPA